jgi:hypothetical protein
LQNRRPYFKRVIPLSPLHNWFLLSNKRIQNTKSSEKKQNAIHRLKKITSQFAVITIDAIKLLFLFYKFSIKNFVKYIKGKTIISLSFAVVQAVFFLKMEMEG